MNLIAQVYEAMADDDEDSDDQSQRLMDTYNQADAAGKAVLDDAFISLCGWSLKTLIERQQ